MPRGTYLQLQIDEFSSIFIDSGLFSQYFAYKRYFNTIIGPWDLSRIVDTGRLYILTEYNVFWTDLARSGPVRLGRPGPARSGSVRPGPARSGPVFVLFFIERITRGPLGKGFGQANFSTFGQAFGQKSAPGGVLEPPRWPPGPPGSI